LFSFLTKC